MESKIILVTGIIAPEGPHITATGYSCQKCGHNWEKRSKLSEGLPRICPTCKSKHWDRPKLAGRGRRPKITQNPVTGTPNPVTGTPIA